MDEEIKKQTERAKALVAQTEAQGDTPFAGSSFDTGVITASDLTPTAPFTPVQPEPTTIFPVDTLEIPEVSPLQPTAPETEATGLSKRIQALNERLIGESSFRAEKETEAGIPEIQKTQADLAGQLKRIQAEAKAIPLQLQQEAEGRGITTGGLRPLETARLRTNAIQALGVSSLLEASRGNLTTALDLVDRAVAQKFDPIREEINANQANLQLILESPDFTRAEKNRAEQQLARQQERERLLDEQEANERQIKEIAINAAAQGADALTLRRIQQTTDPIEAQRIVTEAGFGAQAQPNLQFISGTANQPAGVFNKDTGKFTPTGGGGITGGGVETPIGISPITGQPFNDTQSKSALFATRMENAESTLSLGKNFRDIAPAQFLKSDERRQFEQASKNFVTAVLRKESGAAIAESEFEDAAKIYIPQFGDDDTTLEQKAEARRIAFQEMVNASVGGYEQLKGALEKRTSTGTIGVTSSGIKYTIE